METAHNRRPRFRTDLVAQPIEENGQVFVDVTDPDSGTTFRFYEIEYSVACAMDGARDLPQLVAWASSELGVEPSVGELQTVVRTLEDLGYLDESLGGAGAATPGRAAVPAGAATSSAAVELGGAGRSPLDPGKPPPPHAGDVELGVAGGARAGAARGRGEAESSFAGLLDEDSAPTKVKESAGAGNARAAARPVVELDALEPPPRAPGAGGATAALRARVEEEDDGPTQIPPPKSDFDGDEVSVDLSDHLAIGVRDVKEAIRQSRVLHAVSPPEEEAPAKTPPPVPVASGADKQRAAEKPAAEKKAAESSKAAEKPAAEKPSQARQAEAKQAAKVADVAKAVAAETPAGSGGGLRIFVLLVLLAVVTGAAVYLYMTRMRKRRAQAATSPSAQVAGAAAKPEPSAPPPPPTAILSPAKPKTTAIVAPRDGKISWVVSPGSDVSKGAPVAKFEGYKKYDEGVDHYTKRVAHYQDELDRATAAANKGNMAYATRKLGEKKKLLQQNEQKLASYLISSPRDGVVEPAVKEGDKVKKGADVANLMGEAGTKATFSTSSSKYQQGDSVQVVSTTDRTQSMQCKVTSVQGGKVAVKCPPGGPLSPGQKGELQ